MHKNDPIKRQYIFLLVYAVFCILYIGYFVLQSYKNGRPIFPFEAVIFLILLVLFGVGANSIRRLNKRTEERRQRALSGDQSLLASHQPVSDQNALPLPTTLTMKLSMRFQFVIMGFVLLIYVIGFFIIAALVGGSFLAKPLFWIILGIVLVFTVGVLFASIGFNKLLWNRLLKQEITVQGPGITTHYYGKTTTVLWNDIQCFDVWGGKTKRFLSFEIIGKDSVVRWIVPKSRFRAIYPFRPTIPYDEYCRKMEALEQMVVAKTGQPLYDLRDKKLYLW